MGWTYHGFTGSGTENIEVYINTARDRYMIGITTNGRMWTDLSRLWKIHTAYWDVRLTKNICSQFGASTRTQSLCVYARAPKRNTGGVRKLATIGMSGKGVAVSPHNKLGGYPYSQYLKVFKEMERRAVMITGLNAVDHTTIQTIAACLSGAKWRSYSEHKKKVLALSWQAISKQWKRAWVYETVNMFEKYWRTKGKL